MAGEDEAVGLFVGTRKCGLGGEIGAVDLSSQRKGSLCGRQDDGIAAAGERGAAGWVAGAGRWGLRASVVAGFLGAGARGESEGEKQGAGHDGHLAWRECGCVWPSSFFALPR